MADFNDLQRMSDDLICRAVEAIEHRARSILRHWYAGCALAGVISNPRYEDATPDDCSHDALRQADEMLARLHAEQKKGAKP
jgi:hypothetical protein